VKTILTLLCLSFANPLLAGERLSTVTLSEEPLTVVAVSGKPYQPIVEIADPGISAPVYALKGMIRYANVQGDGYLELDSHFGDKGTFFTRSLAASGPLGKLSGNSDWRQFVLPFNASSGDPADGTSRLPEKLSLALYLPGLGSVSLRNVALYQYAIGENPLQPDGQWFGSRSAGLIGGIGGTLLGLWGGLIGVLSSRGKARTFALASAKALLLLGIASTILGVVAWAAGQPNAVYYPLLFIGVIIIAVIGTLRKTLALRYEQLELKKMQSMDA
jgi:hypothetical protein